MGVYVCGGQRELDNGKLGIVYYSYKDGEINEDDKLLFGITKVTKKPVGWLVNIETNGDTSSGFTHASNSQPLQHPRIAHFRQEHTYAVKMKEMKATEKKANSLRETLEGMTIAELKEWADSRHKKKVLRYYLMELIF